MVGTVSHGAVEIEFLLFHPGPRFLLTSFCRPAIEREPELAWVAARLGLDSALPPADLSLPAREGATGLWLRGLEHCEPQLSSDVEVRELRALCMALRMQADKADRSGSPVAIGQLWDDMSVQLRDSLGLPSVGSKRASKQKTGSAPATHSSTLRGRRWGNLRVQLANALAHILGQAAPANLLPRDTRRVTTFTAEHYQAISNALAERTSGGLAVIAAPAGSGKSELALSYARHEARRYDHIFWLRAGDRQQLERDFFEMARILVREPGGRAHLRREAFKVLETTNRWLIIYASVRDPADLLAYLPWNPDGHKLCTSWAAANGDDGESVDPGWARYLNASATPGLLKPMEVADAQRFLSAFLDSPADELADLAQLVAPSRFATVLAAHWLNHTGAAFTEYTTAWHHLEGDRALAARATNSEDERGYRAATISVRWLDSRGPTDPEKSTADAAADLLRLLEAYGAATFPEEILDHPDWRGGTTPLDDRRLALLDALGLADKASRLPHNRYFEVNPIVRAVVADELDKSTRDDNVLVATRTLLHLLQKPPSHTASQTKLELLPHSFALALWLAPLPNAVAREAGITSITEGSSPPDPWRTYPVLAIELHAHAATSHLALLRVRDAGRRLRLITAILEHYADGIRDALAEPVQTWPRLEKIAAPDDYIFDRPIKRLSQLILSTRLDGHPEVGHRLFEGIRGALRPPAGEPGPATTEQQRYGRAELAQLYFHGALACRDMEELDVADSVVQYAKGVWNEIGDAQGETAATSVQALLARDRGDLDAAHRLATEALATQRRLVEDAERRSPDHHSDERWKRALIELARDLTLLGHINRELGRLQAAAALLDEADASWRRVPRRDEPANGDDGTAGPKSLSDPANRAGLEINALAAHASRALVTAQLGDRSVAASEALKAWRAAQTIYPRAHRKRTLVLTDAGEVLRLAGDVVPARELQEQALDASEHLLPADHRITTGIRCACAASLLDAGDPQQAFAHLQRIVARPSEWTAGAQVARARAWATLGRLLIEVSLSFEPLDDRAELDLAARALEHAQQLLDHATGLEQRHPEVATCLLGRAEVEIRRRSGAAVELVREADDVLKRVLPADAPRTLARARLIRARAPLADPALGPEETEKLREEAAGLAGLFAEQDAAARPGDRLEVALAVIAVEWVAVSGSRARDAALAESLYEAAREELESLLIKPLTKKMSGDPHQLISRSYVELARLAHRVMGPRKKARNEREIDRSRPIFDIDPSALRAVDEILRGERAAFAASTR